MLASYFLTGHGSLNAFLHYRGLSDTAGCLCGDPLEDWQHVLCACPLYADVRDLERLRIQLNESGDLDFGQVARTTDSMQLLGDFARIVFSRRRMLLLDEGQGFGRPVPD